MNKLLGVTGDSSESPQGRGSRLFLGDKMDLQASFGGRKTADRRRDKRMIKLILSEESIKTLNRFAISENMNFSSYVQSIVDDYLQEVDCES